MTTVTISGHSDQWNFHSLLSDIIVDFVCMVDFCRPRQIIINFNSLGTANAIGDTSGDVIARLACTKLSFYNLMYAWNP